MTDTLSDKDRDELNRQYAYLAGQEAGRKQLIDALWATIPEFIQESNYAPSQAAGTPLVVRPQVSDLIIITSIIYSVPQSATGLIQLAAAAIPVSQGTGVLAPIQLILAQHDTRSITIAGTPGPVSLTLMGHRLPTGGVMA